MSLLIPPLVAEISPWLHVSLCVVVPLAWGIAAEFVFRWIAKRHPEKKCDETQHFHMDYHI